MRIVSSVVLLSLVSGCAFGPDAIEPSTSADATMSCTQLKQEIATAEQYELAAREDDTFRFSYIAILPAMVSVYNMHKAEKAAEERKVNLTTIYQQKNCAYAAQTPETPTMPAVPAMPQGFQPPAMGAPGQDDIYSNPFEQGAPGAMPAPYGR